MPGSKIFDYQLRLGYATLTSAMAGEALSAGERRAAAPSGQILCTTARPAPGTLQRQARQAFPIRCRRDDDPDLLFDYSETCSN